MEINIEKNFDRVQSQPDKSRADRRHVLATGEHLRNFAPFYFIQAADTQLGMIEGYLKGLPDPKWDEELRLCKQLVDKCNQMKPSAAFVVVCGDLIDEMPPITKDSDRTISSERRIKQVVDFKRIFSRLQVPLVCVCGNHDVGNEPTVESLNDYKRHFGDDYFYFVVSNVLFIVLNSQFYEHRQHVEEYAHLQDVWLEQLLETVNQYKYSIVFEHIPWYLQDPNEDDEYFNINKSIRLEWLEKFSRAGIDKIMCGHYHRNAGAWYDSKLELVVTSAVGAQLGDDKSGARLVKLLDERIEHKYYNLQDIPDQVQL